MSTRKRITALIIFAIALLLLPDCLGLILDYFVGVTVSDYIGYMGAVIGASAGIIGVLINIEKQDKDNKEMKRLAYQPCLSYEFYESDGSFSSLLIPVEDNPEDQQCNFYYAVFCIKNVGQSVAHSVNLTLTYRDKVFSKDYPDETHIIPPTKEKNIYYEFVLLDAEAYSSRHAFDKKYELGFQCSFKDVFGNKYIQNGTIRLLQMPVMMDNVTEMSYACSFVDADIPVLQN